MNQQEQELDYDAYIAKQEREHWAQLDAEQAEREEQAWFEENEEASLEGACPSCGHFGVSYEPDTQRPCGWADTERVICAHCGEYLGLAQYDPCDCAEWTCEGDDALAYEEWDGEL